ncbi:ankyrin [Xylaria castorea]|nr:ankyrin [Xylaria castorea]
MATFPLSSKIREEEWDHHKSLIISLYLGTDHEESEGVEVGEGQITGKTLDEVAESMRGYGFNASMSQFEAKLNTWGARKNLKPKEWEQVHERLDMLPQATKSRVLISGRVVADSKIKRARRYRKQKSRTANSVPTGDSPNFSALSHHVHIEVQELDGRWVQLFSTDTSATPAIPRCPRAVAVEEDSTAELSVSSLIPVTSTSLRPSVRNHHCSLDGDGNFNESIREYRLATPTAWFVSLPSRRIISAMREYGLYGVSPTGNTTQDRAASTEMIEFDSETSYSRMGNASLQSPNAILVGGQDYRYQNEQNRRIMTPADVRRSKSSRFLLSAIANGIREPSEIPAEALDDIFGACGAVNLLLLQCIKDVPYLFAELVSALLLASICWGKHGAIAWLLKKGFVYADNTVIFTQRGRLTPLEAAAIKGDEALVELLLSYGGDPNKSHHSGRKSGALEFIMQSNVQEYRWAYQDYSKDPPSLNILQKLFQAGAEVRPSNIRDTLRVLDEASASLVILQVNPSQHEEYIVRKFWYHIVQYGEDVHVANLFSRFISDCVERHNGRCISRHREKVDTALVMAAFTGRTKTFLAMCPHSSHTSSYLNERLLSAAIEGGQSVIINSVMLRRPNINPVPHTLVQFDSAKTSPLARSIQNKNIELIECFVNAGILNSLHMGGRFEVALSAAAKIGDVNLVTRLLSSCPNLESQNMIDALHLAIKEGHEVIAHLLLEEGASVYHTPDILTSKHDEDLTLLAAGKGNKSIAQKLLNIGDTTYRWHDSIDRGNFQQLWSSMSSDITDTYLLSFSYGLRYEITVDVKRFDFKPATKTEQVYQDICDSLAATLEGKKGCNSVLDSKLATVQLLTACLAIAVWQNNPTIAEELIRRGANASDATVLTCAVRWGTTGLFQLLLHSMDHQKPVITRGLRTEVLKAVIRQGPDKYDLVCQLIKSGLVDILDTGHSDSDDESVMLTPLGEAIIATEAEFSQKFSYDVARLLLHHGCDPDSIVGFDEESRPPTNQTAMLVAIDVEDKELVKLLIEYGADVNLELRYLVRRTPLQKAAEKGDLSMVRLLLQYGADVNAKPGIAMGGTALQFAAISGNCEVACELLSHGAFLYTPPPKIGGRWPIEGAAEHGRIDMIQFLWNANAGTLFLGYEENGFRERNFKKAMRLARDSDHYACVELIAQLTNLPVTATDVPPVVSPMYIDWPPPERPVD